MSGQRNLTPLFQPGSIAVIGASSNPVSISGRPLKYLKQGFDGEIYPVNPRYESVQGLKCYPSIKDVPGEVDTALIGVGIQRLFPILEECADKGVKSCIILSSGFAEADQEGETYQKQLKEFADRTGIAVCGPNCIGVVNLPLKALASFSPVFEHAAYQTGKVALVSQSGALGHGMFTIAQEAGVGFNYVISSGNEVDLTAGDYLDFLVDDPDTDMILGYLEGWRDGKRFFDLAARAKERKKPLVFLKVGKSQVGQKAALSHTAALTGSNVTYGIVFRQMGVVEAGDLDELIDYAVGFLPKKYPKGGNLAIVTASGGAGILTADKAEEYGLDVPELEGETRRKLEEIIPSFGSAMNPVDITGQVLNDPAMFKKAMNILLEDPDIHMLAVMLATSSGELAEQLANDIADVATSTTKPVFTIWSSSFKFANPGPQTLQERGVPCYQSHGRACRVMGALHRYSEFLCSETLIGKETGHAETAAALEILQQSPGNLGEYSAKKVLQQYGISVTREVIATARDEAVVVAEQIGYPVCMKIESPDILHKSEAKAIKLNINNNKEAALAFEEVLANARSYKPEAIINGVLVQEMVSGGQEVILGVNNDPQFGPVILSGLGGIFVEILQDVSRRVLPLSKAEAYRMIREIKAYPLLVGARGREVLDVDALADALVKVGQLASDLEGEMAELDINPLLVLPDGQGVKVVDALIIRGNNT